MTNKTFRVLQLGKFYPIIGGVEKVMYELTTGLAERGVECDMMAAACKGSGFVKHIHECARLVCNRTWVKVASTMIAPAMITTLRRECRKYDIIHVHHPDPMACLALYLSGYKGKVVLHWHSDIQKQKVLLKGYAPLQDWLLRRADVIVGTSPVYVKESPFLRHVQQKVTYLPIGVDSLLPDEEKVEAILRKYGGRKIVFSLGRLVEYKGYEHLIQAARYLDDSYVILIGGSGPLRYSLLGEIETYGLTDKVVLLGRVSDEDLPSYYGACKLFCLSSVQKTEAFGIVQIEAMSCGKPVVATKIPQSGVSWVNAHGVSGLNVEPADAEELAGAIRSIAGDEDTYCRFAQQARQRYEEIFTKEKMIDNLVKVYNTLLWKEQK